MTKEKPWIVDDTELTAMRSEFARLYVFEPSSDIFNNPYGAGYWLHGVEYDGKKGWLAYEFDESADDLTTMQHKKAIAAWRSDQPLPQKYFKLDEMFAAQAFNVGVAKWGRGWMGRDRDHDLPDIDCVVQWALLGELRYG